MSLSINGDGTLSGVTAIGDVSSTELGYVDGVTAPIQTQIDSGGLVLIAAESFSAASSPIPVDNVFSATYENYKIIINVPSKSASGAVRMQYNVAGSPTATNYQWIRIEASTAPVGPNNERSASATYIDFTAAETATCILADIFRPQLASRTFCIYQAVRLGSAFWTINGTGIQTDSTQFTGFDILSESGTLTGSYSVYGYRN